MVDSQGEEQRMARAMQEIEKLVQENAVVVFSQSGCCMCHVVKRLFCSLGVGPTVHELDERKEGGDMEKALLRLNNKVALPTVFVGGKLVGGVDAVMAAHTGEFLAQCYHENRLPWTALF